MRLRLLILAVALPFALWAASPLGADGAPLSSKIQRKRDAIAGKKATERVLTTSISAYTSRIGALQSDITRLAAQQASIQGDLDTKLARLAEIQTQLRSERARLARLRARLAEARVTLARRLVDLYKADNPDVLTVVLNADGFADLLERSEFARRVGEQDNRIIVTVKTAKADATRTAKRLAGLEGEARRTAAAIQERRDAVVRVKDDLAARRNAYAAVRDKKRTVLSSVRSQRVELEGDLQALEAQQAKIQARLASTAGAGPVRAGLGRSHLAGQRPDRLPVRHALGPPARRRRHRRAVGHAGARGGGGHRGDRRLGRGLRQLRLHPARRPALDVLRAQHVPERLRRPARLPGPGHLLVGLHGALLRPARPLRDAHQRRAGGPHGLPLGVC